MTRRAVVDFEARRRAELEAEKAARVAWARHMAREILGLLSDLRIGWPALATFLRRIARRGRLIDRDEADLARMLIDAKYGASALGDVAAQDGEHVPPPGTQLPLALDAPARRSPTPAHARSLPPAGRR